MDKNLDTSLTEVSFNSNNQTSRPDNSTSAGLEHVQDIYLDYQASTPCDEEVIQSMLPYLRTVYGNPHARSHKFGWDASDALERARIQVANAINAHESKEIIFTSGATESNNLAIKGLAEFWKSTKKHIITIKTEHKCLLEAIKDLERKGWEVDYLDVDSQGLASVADIEKAIRPDTLCIAISAVNHEIGTIQSIEQIGKIARKHKVFLHVDAAQALGKIPIDVQKWNVDTMSISAHKMYGPKGIGALFVSTKPNRMRLKPLNSGGGQERGMRSGTTPVFLAVGFGTACELFANKEYLARESERVARLQRKLYNALYSLTHIYINGPAVDSGKRIPHNLNISVAGVEGESLMMEMPNIAFSSGSACTSANLEPSYVLQAIGVTGPKEDLLHSSIRLSFGKDTTEEQVDQAIRQFTAAIKDLREISPVWEDIMKHGVKY